MLRPIRWPNRTSHYRRVAPRRVLAEEAFRLAVPHGKTPYEPASPSHNSNRFAGARRRQTARRSLLEGACEGPGLGRQSDAGHPEPEPSLEDRQ